MKKLITGVILLLAGATVVYSQGTVFFGDLYVASPYMYVSLGNTRVGGSSTVTTGNPANDTKNGSDWSVALYGNAAGIFPLVQLYTDAGQPVTTTLAGTGNYLGTWLTSLVGEVPNTTFQGQLATVQVLAWYNDGGVITSYPSAGPYGFSNIGTVVVGGPNPLGGAPSLPGTLPYLGNISINANELVSFPRSTPEPGTIVLALIGSSSFLASLLVKRN